jgi:hypothetical protein
MSVKLEIILNDNGSITVNGPISNKLMCWGLLTAAEDVIRNFDPAKKPLIEIPEYEPPADVRGNVTPIHEGR